MLEDEVFDPASYDVEQLLDEFLPLILVNVRLEPKLLPEFFGALNDVRIGLRGLAFFGKCFLFRMRFPRVAYWNYS